MKNIEVSATQLVLNLLLCVGLLLPVQGYPLAPARHTALLSHSKSFPPLSLSIIRRYKKAFKFPYKLDTPDAKYKLPDELEEVSGLSFVEKGLLALVQDEAGKVYLFDTEQSMLVDKHKFEGKGDFEGVELVGATMYSLRSDGVIYQIRKFRAEEPEVSKYKTFLSSNNDTEGLGYLPKPRSLLIACKESASTPFKRYPGARAVYRFDLETMKMDREPFLLLDVDATFRRQPPSQASAGWRDNLQKLLTGKGNTNFYPSGVAVHPITGHIYVIASAGKALCVFNQKGQLLEVQKLDKEVFKQPEGICFSPKGTLFISNEGRGGKGNILKYTYTP